MAPQITLLDAVDCIEGNGPGGGDVRHMGMTLCSRSLYALDEQAALLMGLRGDMPPTVRAARRRGLMQEPAVLTGDALVPASPPFRLPDAIVGKERFLSGNGCSTASSAGPRPAPRGCRQMHRLRPLRRILSHASDSHRKPQGGDDLQGLHLLLLLPGDVPRACHRGAAQRAVLLRDSQGFLPFCFSVRNCMPWPISCSAMPATSLAGVSMSSTATGAEVRCIPSLA